MNLQPIESLPFAEGAIDGVSLVGWDGSKTVRVNANELGGSNGMPEGGEPHQQLVTDAEGVVKWEDRTHYKDSFLVLKTDPNSDPTDGAEWSGGENSRDPKLVEAAIVLANEMGMGLREGRYTHFIFYIDGVRYEFPAKMPFMFFRDNGYPLTLNVVQIGQYRYQLLITYYDGKEHTIQFELDKPKTKPLSPEYITGSELTEANEGKVLGIENGAIKLVNKEEPVPIVCGYSNNVTDNYLNLDLFKGASEEEIYQAVLEGKNAMIRLDYDTDKTTLMYAGITGAQENGKDAFVFSGVAPKQGTSNFEARIAKLFFNGSAYKLEFCGSVNLASFNLDETLSKAKYAADAKAVGDAIETVSQEVSKIASAMPGQDEKIPLGANAHQQLVTDYEGKMRWVDTMQYVELVEEVPENTCSCSVPVGGTYANSIVWASPTISQIGEIRIVEFDGVQYKCAAKERSTSLVLGNLAILNEGDDTGEPFCWMFGLNAGLGYRSHLATNDTVTTTHTIKSYAEVVHPAETDEGKAFIIKDKKIKLDEIIDKTAREGVAQLSGTISTNTEAVNELEGKFNQLTEEIDRLKESGGGGTNTDVVNALDYAAFGLPMLYLTGDTTGMTKDDEVTLNYVYGERTGTCAVKWQGSSSIGWPKKNYTIKFDNAFEAVEGWGVEKKYCFKANFIDHSHARNLVSAKLWGQVVKSRKTVPAELASLVNGGAVDGFPCVIMLNGEFHGLYTWNIPKDGWMLGMSDSSLQQAILCADGYAEGTVFEGDATLTGDFDLEYVSDEDNQDWLLPSLNRCISAIAASDGKDLDTTVAQYLDWDSAIDYYIFTVLLGGSDMIYKNYLLYTFNGVKWYFGAYDMDTTYGLEWDGKTFVSAKGRVTVSNMATVHRVMRLIYAFKKDELKERYKELRESVMSEDNVALAFSNFGGDIPSALLMEDARKWPTIPGTSQSNTAQILNWYRIRCEVIDAEMGVKSGGETPEGGCTNQLTNAEDPIADGIYNEVGYRDKTIFLTSDPYYSASSQSELTTGIMPWVVPNTGAPKDIYIKGSVNLDEDTTQLAFQLWKDGKVYGNGASTYSTITKTYFNIEKLADGYYKMSAILNANGRAAIVDNMGAGYTGIRLALEGTGEGLIIAFDEPIE